MKIFLSTFIVLLLQSFSIFAAKEVDSLEKINLEDISEAEKVIIFNKISQEYLGVDNEKSYIYSRKALVLSEEIGFVSGKADALHNLGDYFALTGDIKKSMDYYNYSGMFYRIINDNEGLGKTYSSIARVKNWQGKFDEAIRYGFIALKRFQSVKNVGGEAKAYNIIGIAYDQSGQTQKAKKYYHKSFNLFAQVEDIGGMGNILNNLAIIAGKEENYEESLNLFNQSLKLNRSIHNSVLQTKILNNIGIIHKNTNNFREAEKSFKEAIEINIETNNTRSLMFSYINMASLYFETDKLQQSLYYLKKTCEIAEHSNSLPEMAECYAKYSEIYEKMGNFKLALDYQRKFKETDDMLKNESMLLNIQRSEEQIELESNKNELILQKKNNEILTLQLEKSSWFKNFILGILIAVIAFLIMFIIQYRSKLKSGEYLAKLNNELSITNTRLIESEAKIKEWNATRDKFFSIISHDLRNPMASLVSFVRIMNRDFDTMDREEIKQLLSDMKLSIEKAQDLLENLLVWTKTQTGKIVYKPEKFNFYDAVQENVHLFQGVLTQKQISLSIFVENPSFMYGDFNMIKTVLRNLMSNALKFTKPMGNIKVSCNHNGQHTIFKVIDDGVGMTQEEISLLFTPGGQKSKHGTADEKGTGIGLLICREFVDKHKGHIEVLSTPENGSEFCVYLPVQS